VLRASGCPAGAPHRPGWPAPLISTATVSRLPLRSLTVPEASTQRMSSGPLVVTSPSSGGKRRVGAGAEHLVQRRRPCPGRRRCPLRQRVGLRTRFRQGFPAHRNRQGVAMGRTSGTARPPAGAAMRDSRRRTRTRPDVGEPPTGDSRARGWARAERGLPHPGRRRASACRSSRTFRQGGPPACRTSRGPGLAGGMTAIRRSGHRV
jgi:hypothetical protein